MANLDIDLRLEGIEKALSDIAKFSAQTTKSVQETSKAFEQFGKKATKDTSSIADSFAAVKTAVIAAGAAIAANISFSAIISGLNEMTSAAIEAENNLNALSLSLRLSGEFSTQAQQDMEQLASSLQATTTISDDAAIATLALAKNLGLTNEQAKATVKAAADLSAVTGEDLTTSVEKLSLTYSGQLGRLNKLVPATKGLSEEQLKAGAAIDLVAQRFSGAAVAASGTFSGSILQAKNAFSDLFEESGKVITQNPLIVSAIKSATQTFIELSKRISENVPAIISFVNNGLAKIADVGVFTINVVKGIISVFKLLFITFSETNIFAQQLITKLLEFNIIKVPLNLVYRGILLVGSAITNLLSILTSIPGASTVFETLGVSIDDVRSNLDKATEKLGELSGSFDVSEASKGVTNLSRTIQGTVVDSLDSVNDSLSSASSAVESFGNQASEAAKKSSSGFKLAAESIKNAKDVAVIGAKEIQESVEKGFKAPFETFFKKVLKVEIGIIKVDAKQAEIIGASAAFATAITKGAAGASQLISQGLGTIANSFIPGIGGAVSEMAALFAQGPEAVSATVKQFITAIPNIIKNIILSIPAVIVALIEGIPLFIQGLVDAIPQLIVGFVKAIPQIIIALVRAIPEIARAFAKLGSVEFAIELVKQIPFIVTELIKEFGSGLEATAQQFVDSLIAAVGGGKSGGAAEQVGLKGVPVIGSIVDNFGSIFGFADGGIVPSGFPNDTFPARLTSGEGIVNNNTMDKLEAFLDGSGGNQEQAQNLTVNLVIGEQQMANVILNLNRRGFRLA